MTTNEYYWKYLACDSPDIVRKEYYDNTKITPKINTSTID